MRAGTFGINLESPLWCQTWQWWTFLYINRRNLFTVKTKKCVGTLYRVRVGHDNSGLMPAWFLEKVSAMLPAWMVLTAHFVTGKDSYIRTDLNLGYVAVIMADESTKTRPPMQSSTLCLLHFGYCVKLVRTW